VRRYLAALRNRSFAALWLGSTTSAIGDALTWVALVWLVVETAGTPRAIGGLVVAYTAPVIVGGLAMGALLDRFDRRRVLIAVNVVLGCTVAAVPVLAHLGRLETWHLYVVAAIYGLLKMANWAGVPSLLPSLLPDEDLTTANALESVSFGIADIAGPALAGVLIASAGGANVLAVDAATYLLFVAALASIRVPSPAAADAEEPSSRMALGPVVRFVRREPAILATTLMFMAFNVGEGMLLVLLPVLARRTFGGGAETYGLLLSAFALASTVGAFVVGAVAWPYRLGRSIGVAQVFAGVAFAGLAFASTASAAALVLVAAGAFASPVTIWAQTIRMRRIPPALRGRTFGVLRTLMQSTPPLGGLVAGLLLAGGGGVGATVLAMVLVMAVPGVLGLASGALEEATAGETDVVAVG
jgi:MFS family permease